MKTLIDRLKNLLSPEEIPPEIGSVWCVKDDARNPFSLEKGIAIYTVLDTKGSYVKYERKTTHSVQEDSMTVSSWNYIFAPVPASWNIK